MSSGYTPLFASLTTGTLCGRWPDIGLWAIVLSQADRRGELDVTPDYLALVTGLPVAEVAACMRRFCEPDPRSRTKALNGARLELIDPESRDWGWRIVNHGQYRERARLMAKDSERTALGKDRERKRIGRERKDDTQCPPESPGVPRRPPLRRDKTRRDEEKEVPTEPVEQARPIGHELDLVPAMTQAPDLVERVFAHWQKVHGHPRAVLDGKRRKMIRERLKQYDEAVLCQAISGYANSPHHMGQNERATKYDDIELMLRDAKHIDAGMRFYESPPRTDLSEKSRRIIDQTEDWVPPEQRRRNHAR